MLVFLLTEYIKDKLTQNSVILKSLKNAPDGKRGINGVNKYNKQPI